MSKITNITELRNELLVAFEKCRDDKNYLPQLAEMNNTVGKVEKTLKMELTYAEMRGEQPEVPFMGKTSGKQIKGNIPQR